MDGLKTGLTNECGHCIDATGVRNGMRLIAVVMGGPTWHASTAAIESLLDYGQKFFTDAQHRHRRRADRHAFTARPWMPAVSPSAPRRTSLLTLPTDATNGNPA